MKKDFLLACGLVLALGCIAGFIPVGLFLGREIDSTLSQLVSIPFHLRVIALVLLGLVILLGRKL